MSTIIYKYYIYINVQIEFVKKKKKKDCTTLPKGNKIMPQLTKVNETTKVRNAKKNIHKNQRTNSKQLYTLYTSIYRHILTY